ncbi:transcriptional regulator [Bradyrhizobium sp. 146]|uniref:helix-turn-helix transcriptional regulator n=1 Tax=Bradyrhizobium sp. 146 TaxID=2782622 RepID=UPI001FF91CA1|nr:transcriptional regulator [Bradyrhizobium sp. 146]MCK1706127.1 transcriptional regulator [Bradyrhizobium sp. 146]
MTTVPQHDYALDYVHRWEDWCAMTGMSRTTGWREVKAGRGPVITKLTARRIGVRHRHHLAWLAAREPQEAAAA